MEGVFAFALERAFAGVIFVDVDQAVAFVHFTGVGGDDVDFGATWCSLDGRHRGLRRLRVCRRHRSR